MPNVAGGVAVAGIVGGIVGLGIPEAEARDYEKEMFVGLIAVQPGTRYDDAFKILQRDGATEMKTGTLTQLT